MATPLKLNFKTFSDDHLLSRIKQSVQNERALLLEILESLKEIERRRLFAGAGFSSLFEFCVKYLGYSEGSAQRRIVSMRLMSELPEIADDLAEGKLTLSSVAQMNHFFNQQQTPHTTEQKKAVIKALHGMSSREAEQELASRNPEPKSPLADKRPKPITTTLSKLECVVETTLIADIEELKSLLSHAMPKLSISEALSYSVKLALERHRPKKPKDSEIDQSKATPMPGDSQRDSAKKGKEKTPSSNRSDGGGARKLDFPREEVKSPTFSGGPPATADVGSKSAISPATAGAGGKSSKPAVTADAGGKSTNSSVTADAGGKANMRNPHSRYISAELRRQVWHRDGGKCTFVGRKYRRRCGSRYLLQYDHRKPFVLGGLTTLANLRLLCAEHNRLWARQCGLVHASLGVPRAAGHRPPSRRAVMDDQGRADALR